ncbi:MAG: hypothetical protein P1U86_04230 [Verrucomicrobiales bacterium]|nr:hypothetical protein [Verrucomicrobiales bacterium]
MTKYATDKTVISPIVKVFLTIFLILCSVIPTYAGWLPREVHEVRAYVYDYAQEKGNKSLLRQGRLHQGVINQGGAKLSDDQIERLKDALRSSQERKSGAFCYMPHHGFVFFDKDGKAMGHIELCFQCGNVASSPEGLPEREWDWKEIRTLLEELNVPILKADEDYSKLYSKGG